MNGEDLLDAASTIEEVAEYVRENDELGFDPEEIEMMGVDTVDGNLDSIADMLRGYSNIIQTQEMAAAEHPLSESDEPTVDDFGVDEGHQRGDQP
jgi:hypothetical protein